MARLRLGLLGLLLLAAFLAWRAAPEVFWTLPAGAEGEALERVYREAHPAVFRVEVAEGPRGTGFFVGKDEALTAYHVVAGKREVVLYTAAGTRLKARVVGFSEPRDLAYLKAEGEGPRALPLGPPTPPRPGEAVLHIGNGRGEVLAPRYGRVLRLEASPSPFLPQGLVETSLPLAPGDSGGPVLNREGRVLGVAVAIGATEEGFRGYFTPLFGWERTLEALRAGLEESWPYLGLRGPRGLTPELARELGLPPGGVLVGEVVPGGAAHRAGLRGVESGGVPDVILEVNGVPVNAFEDLLREVRRYRVGDRVRLTVRRGGQVFPVEVVLAPFPGR